MAGIRFRRFSAGARRAISQGMSTNVTIKGMRQPVRRAEGLSAGCGVMPFHPWSLDPAQELPGRRCPMWVLPPPERSLPRRIAAAVFGLSRAIVAGAALMVLAQQLTLLG
jgi:hypothetical protein